MHNKENIKRLPTISCNESLPGDISFVQLTGFVGIMRHTDHSLTYPVKLIRLIDHVNLSPGTTRLRRVYN